MLLSITRVYTNFYALQPKEDQAVLLAQPESHHAGLRLDPSHSPPTERCCLDQHLLRWQPMGGSDAQLPALLLCHLRAGLQLLLWCIVCQQVRTLDHAFC